MTIIQLGLDQEDKHLLQAILTAVEKQGAQMTKEMQNITDEVAAMRTVVDGAKKAFEGVAAQIEANKTDPVALQALADDLKGERGELAAAVALVDPPAPTPVP